MSAVFEDLPGQLKRGKQQNLFLKFDSGFEDLDKSMIFFFSYKTKIIKYLESFLLTKHSKYAP